MPAQFQFQWSDDLKIDGGVVDAEHRSLLELAERVSGFEEPRRRLDEFERKFSITP